MAKETKYQWLLRIVDRAKAEKIDECIEWPFARMYQGYGRLRHNKVYYYAHREVLRLFSGEEGEAALHQCDNPSCVNPYHLSWGTQDDNMKDMASKKRSCLGEKNGQSKLNHEKAEQIRAIYAKGGSTHRSLADQFGVSTSHIGRVLNNEFWK